MEEQNKWMPFREIEWSDPKFNKFNIDTRDFHVGYQMNESPHPDEAFLYKKYNKSFFHTEEELKTLIERYYTESGGEKEWRYFSIQSNDNWSMKYIRVYRTQYGFLICNNSNTALRKDILNSPVKEEY